ncbi:MAG: Nif3-like dinuclear metal center hexameric protein [Armatimonadetes bacterium]|nr:Nif3-like dinuclear metal center hexameric protein [Armatimonadota bacterium]
MTNLHEVASFLDEFFQSSRFHEEANGVLHETARPIQRVGLALEPWPGLAAWAEADRLDALFLHRAAHLEAGALPTDMGVLAYHLAFDEKMTLGWNPRLADMLHLTSPEVIGWKQRRPLGMIGDVPDQHVAEFYRSVSQIFGGRDESRTCECDRVSRVAVVGGMTEALVHEASERGADVYITGQFRQPGRVAMLETGIGVIAVGHRRGEEWGLRALAQVLRERWADLEAVLPPPHPHPNHYHNHHNHHNDH